jgi:hypothetical protein
VNTTAVGRSLEQQVERLFRSRPRTFEVRPLVPVGSVNGTSQNTADLIVAFRQGDIQYSILVECKNLSRPLTKPQFNQIVTAVGESGAQVGLVVTTAGITDQVERSLLDHPYFLHFTVDELRNALFTGTLDDRLPKCVAARFALARLSKVPHYASVHAAEVIDHVVNLAAAEGNAHTPPHVFFRAAVDLCRGLARAGTVGGSPMALNFDKAANIVWKALSPQTRAVLSPLHASSRLWDQCLLEAADAALVLCDRAPAIPRRREGPISPIQVHAWQQVVADRPAEALRLLMTILCRQRVLEDLPEYQHGGIDDVSALLVCLRNSEDLVARIFLDILVTPTTARAKTIVAQLGRRFIPFASCVIGRSSWEEVRSRAVRTIRGPNAMTHQRAFNPYLNVWHDVSYMAAMHGVQAIRDDICSIRSLPEHMQSLTAMNVFYGRHNYPRMLSMLQRKCDSRVVAADERWVLDWAPLVLRALHDELRRQRRK